MKVLLGAVVVARKTQQLKEERAALRIVRVIAQFGAHRLHGLDELSRPKQFGGVHEKAPKQVVKRQRIAGGRRQPTTRYPQAVYPCVCVFMS